MKDVMLIATPIVASILTYLGVVYTCKKEIQKSVEESNLRINEMKVNMEEQSKLYSKNTQTDIIGDILKQTMNSKEGKSLIAKQLSKFII